MLDTVELNLKSEEEYFEQTHTIFEKAHIKRFSLLAAMTKDYEIRSCVQNSDGVLS